MNHNTVMALSAIVLAGLAFDSYSKPNVTIHTSYYSVSGSTDSAIRTSLNSNSPVRHNGKRYDAYTRWQVEWKFSMGESNGQCEIQSVNTSVDVQYTLPELQASVSIPESLKLKWNNFKENLVRHEIGHKDIGVKAASKIDDKLRALSSKPTCETLEADANRLGNRILEEFRAMEIDYDRSTQHGMRDGAVFP